MTRIIHIAPFFHPRIGGVETHVRRVCEELARSGLSVAVLTHEHDPSLPDYERRGALDIHRLPAVSAPRAWAQARPILANADIVHCHDAYSFYHFYLPYRLLCPRVPVFITFHGYEGYPIPRSAIRLRRWAARWARGTIAVGAFIESWYGTRADAITYGGVDVPAGPPPEPGNRAVFIGRIEPDTSLRVYLQALALLEQEHSLCLPLDVCGEGRLRAELEQYARARSLQVRWHSAVPDPQAYLLRARFAFVSGYLSILQAMAAGRLVCAVHENPLKADYLTTFPGAPYMLIAGDASELACRLSAHLRDPRLALAHVQAARRFAANTSWQRVGQLYLELYDRCRTG